MYQQNVSYILEKKRDNYPRDIAFVDAMNSKAYTYDDFCRRVNKMANMLQDAGMKKGDRLCCIAAVSVEYFDIFFAAARLGVLVCPLNYRLAPFEMIRIVKDAKPKAFIFDAEFSNMAKEIVAASPNLDIVLFLGSAECNWAKRMEEIVAPYPEKGPEIVGDSEDPLLMVYTAGSTGNPKGVPLKQRHLFFSALNWIIDYSITKKDYTLQPNPIFHIGGHMVITIPHLVVGAKVLLLRRFEPETVLHLIAQEKITTTFLGSTMLKMILSLPNWKDYDLRSLRFIGVGGEAVPQKIIDTFAEIGIPVFNCYGLTETSDGAIGIRPEYALGKHGNCIGKPLTFTDARIADQEGHDVEIGVEGELLLRGPSVVEAYWNRPEETAKAFCDGWLHTGDLAVKDEEGFFHFIGRKDDMINTGGENVYPAEIEGLILSYPKVADVAVIGVLDERWGQTIKAVIVPKSGMTIDEKDLLDTIEKKVGRFKRPRIVQFVESLPKIGIGKLDRVKIKNMYGKK